MIDNDNMSSFIKVVYRSSMTGVYFIPYIILFCVTWRVVGCGSWGLRTSHEKLMRYGRLNRAYFVNQLKHVRRVSGNIYMTKEIDYYNPVLYFIITWLLTKVQ